MNWGLPMTDKTTENDDLALFFEAAKGAPPPPPDALMTRVLADAMVTQPRARPGFSELWREFARTVGGWPAMAGLATATVAGVWLGVAPPAVLPETYLSLGESSYLVDTAPDLGFDLFEEAL